MYSSLANIWQLRNERVEYLYSSMNFGFGWIVWNATKCTESVVKVQFCDDTEYSMFIEIGSHQIQLGRTSMLPDLIWRDIHRIWTDWTELWCFIAVLYRIDSYANERVDIRKGTLVGQIVLARVEYVMLSWHFWYDTMWYERNVVVSTYISLLSVIEQIGKDWMNVMIWYV
jgi:hypothetical protein